MPDTESHDDEPVAEPTVHELLVARITAVLVGAPAMVQDGITYNFLD
jgi:hypothetical protein